MSKEYRCKDCRQELRFTVNVECACGREYDESKLLTEEEIQNLILEAIKKEEKKRKKLENIRKSAIRKQRKSYFYRADTSKPPFQVYI